MYALAVRRMQALYVSPYVFRMSLHPVLKIVLGIVHHLILASFFVYGEWVYLAIVSACHSSINILTAPTETYCGFSFI